MTVANRSGRHDLLTSRRHLDELAFQGFQGGRGNVKAARLNTKCIAYPVCRTTDLIFIPFLSLYGKNRRLQSFR